jgi:hypothetical protein
MSDSPLQFEVITPLGFTVRCSEAYWQQIVVKHPAMAERLEDVKLTLSDPNQIRQSARDGNVYLFYRADPKRWVCVVTRRLNGDGFLVTAYPTDAIKRGKQIWSK